MPIGDGKGEFTARRYIYETLSFQKFRDRWIPGQGASLSAVVDRQGQVRWDNLEWFNLLTVKLLESDKRSIFNLDFPLGQLVNDTTDQPNYIEGGDVDSYAKLFEEGKLPVPLEQRIPRSVQEFVARTVNGVD